MGKQRYEIREICGDWALDIPPYGSKDTEKTLLFNSRSNADLVKAILEWEDAHPNKAVPYPPTLTPPNEPLTLEQLREMDGEPVWIVRLEDNLGWWAIVRLRNDRANTDYGAYFMLSDYGKTWEVYAYPPAHIDREAWEPCLFCCEKSKGRKTLAFDSAGDAVTLEIYGNAAAIESDSMEFIVRFCPECGRPLTPEARAMLEKRLRG